MDQRGVRSAQLSIALEYGKVYNRAGAEWRIVRRKDLPKDILRENSVEKSVGLVVCIEGGEIATVYFRDDPGHYIRCKSKKNLRSRAA